MYLKIIFNTNSYTFLSVLLNSKNLIKNGCLTQHFNHVYLFAFNGQNLNIFFNRYVKVSKK